MVSSRFSVERAYFGMLVVALSQGNVAATAVGPLATAAKIPFPNATERHDSELDKTRLVQVIPLGDVSPVAAPTGLTTKMPLPNAMDCQFCADGSAIAVQFVPSGEIAALVVALAIATKVPLPNVTPLQFAE